MTTICFNSWCYVHNTTKLFHKLLLQRNYVSTNILFKKAIDYSKVPVLNEEDLQERLVRGSGPGGQSVQKTSNACTLVHIPTGTSVKCHATRSVAKNRELARQRLIEKLDDLMNGENSVSAQKEKILQEKSYKKSSLAAKRRNKKLQWKLELALENGNNFESASHTDEMPPLHDKSSDK